MGNRRKLERLFVEYPECLGYGEFVDGEWKYYKQSDIMLISVEDALKDEGIFKSMVEIPAFKKIAKQALRICKIWRLLNVDENI